MKIKKFNESSIIPSNDEDMKYYIFDIIRNNVSTHQIKYTDDFEVDPITVEEAATEIVKNLKKLGVDFDLIYSINKYNI